MGARAGQREGFGGWRDALWLAGRDARKTWLSFPVAALVALVFGLYAILLYSVALGDGPGGRFGGFGLDFWFLVFVPVLGVNFLFNKDYYYRFREDNLSKRLAFLRGLPICAGKIVLGRVAIMLLTLTCTSPFFFLTPYVLHDGLRERVGLAGYLCFVAFWLGYALFMVGFLVFVWLGLSWEAERLILLALPVFNLLLAVTFNFFFETGLVAGVLGLARDHGRSSRRCPSREPFACFCGRRRRRSGFGRESSVDGRIGHEKGGK